jgi:hypothetical protein
VSLANHPIDRLKTQIWYQAVEIALGKGCATAVELFLEPEKDKLDADNKIRPRRWRGYRDGIRVPKKTAHVSCAVEVAEPEAPGTARWFLSPMWRALKGEFLDRYEIEDALSKSESIGSIIFCNKDSLGLTEADLQEYDSNIQTQLVAAHNLVLDNIGQCTELEGRDLLEAVVLLLEHGRLSGSLAVTRRALDLYDASSRKISEIPELRRHLRVFFEAIEDRYTPIFNTPAKEIFPPWHARLPDLVEEYFDIEAGKVARLNWGGGLERPAGSD